MATKMYDVWAMIAEQTEPVVCSVLSWKSGMDIDEVRRSVKKLHEYGYIKSVGFISKEKGYVIANGTPATEGRGRNVRSHTIRENRLKVAAHKRPEATPVEFTLGECWPVSPFPIDISAGK